MTKFIFIILFLLFCSSCGEDYYETDPNYLCVETFANTSEKADLIAGKLSADIYSKTGLDVRTITIDAVVNGMIKVNLFFDKNNKIISILENYSDKLYVPNSMPIKKIHIRKKTSFFSIQPSHQGGSVP